MHKADLTHSNKNLQEKLEEIYQLRRTRSKVNWDRTQFLGLLEKFGNPHLELPPVIHVAGTNGKGSVIAYLKAMFKAEGLKAHAYTSPHLIDINERIVLAGEQIENEYLETLLDQALDYNQGAPLSFFEMTTAAAFRAFADVPADVLLLEVGMGGRLDCTNVIEQPMATVINRISLDHTMFLGDDIKGIAREKAGIMKKDVPCVIGYQTPEVLDVLKQEAEAIGARPVFFKCHHNKECIVFSCEGQQHDFPLPALLGKHQINNAGVALATAFAIKDKVDLSPEAMAKGLQNVRWEGRLQKLPSTAFKKTEDIEIWVDSGHNDSAAEALAEQVRDWQAQDDRPVILITGMLLSKEPEKFLEPLLPLVSEIYIVPIKSDPQTHTKASIEETVANNNVQIPIFESANFYEAIQNTASPARILIAGSTYLAGEVLGFVRKSH